MNAKILNFIFNDCLLIIAVLVLLRYEKTLMRRFNKTEEVSSAVRYVPEQPLEFTRFNNGVKQYNLRKLNQMPYHLAHSKRYKQLNTEVNQQ